MSAHTPGKWSLTKDGRPELNNQNNIVYGPDGIAIVYGQANDADARLIAAAPELLAFAEWFIANRDGPGTSIAREAIAKATGEAA